MENFKIESRYLKLCNEFRVVTRRMKAAFYRPDYQKLSMCPLIKRLGRASISKHATEPLKGSAIIIIIIIFISSWYKIVKSTNKNQPSTRYNYSFHATVRTKENVRLDITSSTVKTTACIYWILIHTIQLKFYYK